MISLPCLWMSSVAAIRRPKIFGREEVKNLLCNKRLKRKMSSLLFGSVYIKEARRKGFIPFEEVRENERKEGEKDRFFTSSRPKIFGLCSLLIIIAATELIHRHGSEIIITQTRIKGGLANS